MHLSAHLLAFRLRGLARFFPGLMGLAGSAVAGGTDEFKEELEDFVGSIAGTDDEAGSATTEALSGVPPSTSSSSESSRFRLANKSRFLAESIFCDRL